MAYPVGNGTKEDFDNNWYIAQGHGDKTSYGYHDGLDINLKSSGDTDLGQPVKAIKDWVKRYYHFGSHPISGFGIHYVYEISTKNGTRWIHCAHNQKNPEIGALSSGKAGDILSHIGKSGRPRNELPAHLHIACFKVDPQNLPKGIDTIATSKKQLDDWWEDPLQYFEESIMSGELETCMADRQKFWDERDTLLREVSADTVEGALAAIRGLRSRNTDLANQVGGFQAEVNNREEQVVRLKDRLLILEEDNEDLRIKLKHEQTIADEMAKDKGTAAIEMEQLRTQLAQAKLGSYTITVGEFFKLLLNQSIKIKKE